MASSVPGPIPARLRALSNYSRVISGSARAGTDAPAPARVTLPSDLPGSLKYLDDAQLQRLSKAVAVEINRRNRAPKNEIAPAAPSEERCASNARGGIAASADATNTTPPTTIFVTFVDPNSGQGGVLTVPAF